MSRCITIGKKSLPDEDGMYYWTEWAQVVRVYRKRGGRWLYVCIPGGIEVRITPRIAGSFHVVSGGPVHG